MKKVLKPKPLLLFSIIDLNQLRKENHLEGAVLTDFSVGWNQNVYLLFEQPSGQKNEVWLKTPSIYTVVEIKVVIKLDRAENDGSYSISYGTFTVSISFSATYRR